MIKSVQRIPYLLFFVLVISGCEIDGSITASPETIERGQSSTLNWSIGSYSGEADSASIEPGIGPVALDGSIEVSPEETTTYTITWTGKDGTATDTVTVTVVEPPTVSISADKTTIDSGESVTLTWTSENAVGCTIDEGIGSVSLNGSQVVTPSKTTTYIITAQGQLSSSSDSVTIKVKEPPL